MPRRLIDFAALCVASILFAFVIVVLIAATANAQEHHPHAKQDEEIHARFYSTWMMPDNPDRSCCNQRIAMLKNLSGLGIGLPVKIVADGSSSEIMANLNDNMMMPAELINLRMHH